MRDALKAYLALATGLADVPRQKARAAAKLLVIQGEATAEQVTTLTEDLMAQTKANREAVTALVKYEVDRTLGRVGLASAEEVSSLAARVQALEASVRALRADPSTKGAQVLDGPGRRADAAPPRVRTAQVSRQEGEAPVKRVAVKRIAVKAVAPPAPAPVKGVAAKARPVKAGPATAPAGPARRGAVKAVPDKPAPSTGAEPDVAAPPSASAGPLPDAVPSPTPPIKTGPGADADAR
ncbi:MAG: hypothetical protein JWL64_2476 [Frankiales bacterium]|nr:hypothetical protein [Frankiales bacterium]